MNKIYKVIWNKTRGMYMVVSELAKSQSKGSGSVDKRRKLTQSAAALALFFSIVSAGGTAWAANSLTIGTAELKDSAGTEVKVLTVEKGDTSTIGTTLDQVATNKQDITSLQSSVEDAKKYTYRKVDAEEKAREAADTELNERITNEANAIHETTNKLQSEKANASDVYTKTEVDNELATRDERITAEAQALQKRDTELNDRITAVKESLQADASVQDGTVVKAGSTIGKNVQDLDTALAKETAARIGADKAQDAVIQQVNQNAANGIATLATAYNNEVATREAADNELNERITNEANAIHETTNQLQNDLNTETQARQAADTELNERITNEANAIHDEIKAGDTALNDRITAVKESLQQEAADTYVSKNDASVQDGAVVKANNKVGQNVQALDTALAAETAARVTSDKAQNEAIATVNSNLVTAVNTINQNVSDGFAALNQADANEAAAREAADNALDSRTTALEDKTEAITYDKDSKTVMVDGKITATEGVTDGTTKDGKYVKQDNYTGQNLNALDQGLQDETKAREAADAAEAEARQAADTKLQENIDAEAATRAAEDQKLNKKITAEKKARIAADTKLVEAVNSGLSLSDDNVLQKNTTTIDAKGNVTTTKTDANEMIMNKGKDNQITLNEKGIKVGTNSTVVDKDGVYTGGGTYSEAKAAMSSDGSIKGANGKFTVDSATGSVNINNQISLNGATGAVKANSLNIGDGNFKVDSNGAMSAANGSFKVDGNGAINAAGGNFKVDSNGGVTAANGKASIDSNGKITSTGLDAGSGTIQTTGTVKAGTVEAGTVNTGDLNVTGKATVKDLDVTGEFNAKTLNSKVDANNYTTITGGNVTSKNFKMSDDGEIQASSSTFNEKGSTVWARDDESKGTSTVTADSVKQSLSDVGDNVKNYASRELHQNTDNKYEITDSVVEDKNSNVTNKTAAQSESTISDGTDTNKSTFRQKIDQILQEIKSGNGSTTVTQTDVDITNTAKNGTITNEAQNLVNTASGDMTNTIGGKMLNDVTGDMENKVGGNLINTVKGNMTSDVTGDSSVTAENINNTARNKITNKALDVETDASSSIVNKVSNDYGINTSTQTSSQTVEDMSQADGKTASYTRGAGEQKSQLTDGDKKTTIDTVAGQTNTNITDGTNTSNSLQKADQVASSVTDGTNTTVVNQDARSIASSITDGTKSNTMSNTVDGSAQQIKASDTQYSATSKTATRTEEALVNGSTIVDVVKDSGTGTISAAVTDGTNITGSTMTAKGITNTTTGDITNSAANISNTTTGNMTNNVGGNLVNTIKGDSTTTVTGKVTEDYKSDLSTKVGGNETHAVTGNQTNTIGGSQTTTVTGDSSLSAKNITNTATKKLSNNAADIENSASSSILNKVGDNVSSKMEADKITTVVKDGSKSTTVTDTASTSERRLVSGNIIDILNDAENGYVNTTVQSSDGSSSTGVKQTTTDITNTAKQGSITNEAKNLVNKATEKLSNSAAEIENKATTSIKDSVGKSTVTTTDSGTTFENTDHAAAIKGGSITKTTISGNTVETGQVTTDYATVNKDLTVNGTTTTDKLVVNNGATIKGGASITGGTTTDTLHVTSTSTFDGMATFKDAVSMEKDLSVGGNVTVAGDVSAKSYKVADKTYIDQNGINANSQKVTNVADGDVSEGSTDAVNGGQLHATNQRVSTVENRMDGVENRVDRVENRVDNLDNRIDKVGASAAAMANLHPMDFDEDSKLSVAAAVGTYRSETAGALGVFYRPTDRVMMNVSTSFGNGENMVGGGVSFKLGKSSKRLQQAEATNAALSKQVTNLQNRLDALLGVLNPNLSKAFPDVPANHWAYEAVSKLAGNDIIQGYEDGKYHGERTMSRYEMAEIIYNALSKGAKAEAKLVEEFRPELQAMAAQRKA